MVLRISRAGRLTALQVRSPPASTCIQSRPTPIIVGCSEGQTSISRRMYATEASTIPASTLLRSQPPLSPPPLTQSVHPEAASKVDNTIDEYLCHFHETIAKRFSLQHKAPSLSELYNQLADNRGKVLEEVLPYEDTPKDARKLFKSGSTIGWHESLRLAQRRFDGQESDSEVHDDGLLLVAHVLSGDGPPVVSWSLGFAIQTVEGSRYVVSCSHTLESAAHTSPSPESRSSTIVATRSGLVYPVTSIPSSLPLHDIVLYCIPPSPSNDPHAEPIKTVPVALYPPYIGTSQALMLVAEDSWQESRILGYKDSRGRDAEPGTYAELNSIMFDTIPTPGSSGGPLVSPNGAVTGLVRGSRLSHGDRRRTGFATPAEKIFEMFQLPGLILKNKA